MAELHHAIKRDVALLTHTYYVHEDISRRGGKTHDVEIYTEIRFLQSSR